MAKRLKYKYHTENDPATSDEVYVFNSNLAGLHREVFSSVASSMFGAQTGVSVGYVGNSYAIPTKDRFIRSLSLTQIKKHVADFIAFTNAHPEMKFYVVRLDLGTHEFKPYHIAPMFAGCARNCRFPVQWKPFLK